MKKSQGSLHVQTQRRRYLRIGRCLVIAVVLLGFTVAAPAQAIRVLIITGMDIDAHNWRETTRATMAELARDARMKVDTLTDIYALGSFDLSRYDVVYLNFNNWKKPDPDARAQNNLQQFVARGGGLVIAHFASGSFEGWPNFIKLAGRVWDRKNTHDPRGKFMVEITDRQHPITKGLQSYETDDELYICLTGDEPIHLLAQAKSVTTGTYHPIAFTHNYSKGRVFHLALGHDASAIHIEGTANFIRRGVAWAAKKPITTK